PAAQADPTPPLTFPATAEVTVIQGSSTDLTLAVDPADGLKCTGGEPFFWFDSLYSVDAAGDVARALPTAMPIQPPPRPVGGQDCQADTPPLLTMTVTVAVATPVGDYTAVVRWGKGDPGLGDNHAFDATVVTIHVVPPESPPPPPVILAPPAPLP